MCTQAVPVTYLNAYWLVVEDSFIFHVVFCGTFTQKKTWKKKMPMGRLHLPSFFSYHYFRLLGMCPAKQYLAVARHRCRTRTWCGWMTAISPPFQSAEGWRFACAMLDSQSTELSWSTLFVTGPFPSSLMTEG